ncbi:tyrosine-type recombinase/integrase [Gymnodinialimonas ceratoperidinii]|uniref:Integrase arm-type DNA-binding domain-containing protein n=1 Tax=Gymnodinialimonas ceratoperidinii TaxID=2856823 RepID=A0A8F6TZR0_9RHOB|nr:site-specific integrase [Gymnodinialimonas ceratoperidinii]QXT41134.1 integrase arm-type DNA-binding domain-containing protein [Gymnodinialimonas ceratoperidinii]
MTISNALTQLKAKNLGPGKHFDGQGLILVKSRKDSGKWIVRLVVDGKRREMGLGRWPDVSIAEARERAREARSKLRDGVDPVSERQKARRAISRLTVAEAIQGCFEARQAELKNDGQAGRWMSPLSVHVLPKIGMMAIEDVDQHELKRVLEPIWHTKADTARKAMNRMSLTLKHAAALGLDVDLQAVMKAQALLGKRRHATTHIPSLPYQDAPAFHQWLCTKPFVSATALRFLVLTVARTSEVRFATFDEIDGDIWTIPASRRKTSGEHRVPLPEEALKIVRDAREGLGQQLLFPTARGNPMSDAAMSRFMQREGYEARPHGFRSTFRSWAEECTDASFEVKETALGHQVGSHVERAYQRSDLLLRRSELMLQWATFLTS